VLINLFMLFPIGFIVYVFSKDKPFLKTIIITLLVSLIIETLQFVLPIHRNTEILDIILNFLSGVISASYCHLLSKLKFKKTQHT